MPGRIIKQNNEQVKLPIIGKVKIGEKRINDKGKEYPVSLDYFVGFGKYKSFFEKAYPDEPNRIQVIFVSNDAQQSCNERYELRNDKGDLYGFGNGKQFQIWDGKDYKPFEIQNDKDREYLKQVSKESKSPKGWEVILTLQFIMPKIRGVLGLWQFSTKGKASSVNAIRDTFDFVQEKAGSVLNIVFDLTVEKVQSQKPNDPSVYPVVNLICNVSEENLQLAKGFLESGHNLKLTDETIEENKGMLEEGPKVKTDVETKSNGIAVDESDNFDKHLTPEDAERQRLQDGVDYYTARLTEAKEKGDKRLIQEVNQRLGEALDKLNNYGKEQ